MKRLPMSKRCRSACSLRARHCLLVCCAKHLPLTTAGESMEAVAMVQDIIMRDTSGMLLFGIAHAGEDDGAPPADSMPSCSRPNTDVQVAVSQH